MKAAMGRAAIRRRIELTIRDMRAERENDRGADLTDFAVDLARQVEEYLDAEDADDGGAK